MCGRYVAISKVKAVEKRFSALVGEDILIIRLRIGRACAARTRLVEQLLLHVTGG